MSLSLNPWRADAEAFGKTIVEIIGRKKKVWQKVFTGPDDELRYVAWLATWAFHWGGIALKRDKEHDHEERRQNP